MIGDTEMAIVERLESRLGGEVRVFARPGIRAGMRWSQMVPAVSVVFLGYRVLETGCSGRVARVRTQWSTVICVRDASDMKGLTRARARAGEIADTVYQALAGWRPLASWQPMELADGPAALAEDGFYWLPLAWSTQHVMRGGG